MKNFLVLSAIVTLILLAPAAYAKGGSGSGSSGSEEQRIKIEEEIEDGVERLEFDIRGMVTSISGDSFMILGQTIIIDPGMVLEFRQRAEVVEGNMLRVKGVIMDGVFLAERIDAR